MNKRSRRAKKKTMTVATIAALALSIQFVSVAAASSTSTQLASVTTIAASSSATAAKVVSQFEAYVKKQGELPQAIAYLKVNINEVTKSEATIMVLHLENAIKKQMTAIEKRFEKSSVQLAISKVYSRGDTFDNIITRTKDTSLKVLLREARDSGYKLETAEGFYFPVVDYSRFKPYVGKINADIEAYIDIMAVESDQVKVKDAGIMISYQQLVGRALNQESFIVQYPYSNRAAHIRNLFSSYETLTYYGTNNTPLFDYSNKVIQPNALRGYMGMLQRNDVELSPYLTKLQAFMNLLEDNEYKLTVEGEKFRKDNVPIQ
ncbi:hypothetical protein [Cohnella sp. WQ 127256]|uniref:hypothetical protein n=1 Tax=Cohnella sp. WQ 127256 TaxID=2938790 RepID=UPI0021198ED3|nr:hypothetical protein [Cohnella sp. WQ 127256]